MKIKKMFFAAIAMTTGALFTASCSQDELTNEMSVDNMVNATFTVESPEGISTRAIGDGTTVNVVKCVVYDAKGEKMELDQTLDLVDKKATYSVRLVKGQAYRVAFFAYNDKAGAYDVTDMKNIQVLGNQASNMENRDAFTAYADITAKQTMNAVDTVITLYRPFAQLNLGAYKEDVEAAKAAGVIVENSKITVTNVYTAFSAYDDAVVGGTSEMIFDMNAIPTESLSVDADKNGTNEQYEYLALNYLLVGDKNAEKALTDVTFTWKTEDGKTNDPVAQFTNVPVQRNYRTNIIGMLLTNPAQFNIVVDEKFEEPDYIVSQPWDGSTVVEPSSNETEWTISSPAEWVYLKQNGTKGKNIKLAADIDFGGYEVKGLSFTGEFDGNGHKMSNMTLLCGGSYYSNGLFQGDASSNVTVKNLTIENVNAECNNPDQGYVGTIFGDVQKGTVTLSNVNVKNTNLCGVQSVGGLVGFVADGATLNVENCNVDGSNIANYAVAKESGFVAGLVGRPVGTVNVTNSTVTNTTIDAYYAARRGEASIQPIVGNNTELTAGDDVKVIKKFLGAELNGTVYNTIEEALENINAGDKIALGEGIHTIPASAKGKTFSFVGAGVPANTIVKCDAAGADNLNAANITFENVTIESDGATYRGFTHVAGATYKNCIIKNQLTLYNDGQEALTFEGCTFEVSGDSYNLWTWGASVTFTKCTFNCDGKAALVYGGTPESTVTFNECTFNDNGGIDGKAAIETGDDYGSKYNIHINSCTVTGFDVTTPKKELGGDDLGTNVWGNKDRMTRENLNVFVNENEVY